MYNKDHISDPIEAAPRYALFAARWAVGTVLILIIIKSYAYAMSGSVALLGTLVDSLTDGGISLMMLLAVRFSMKPADAEHRYGHGKVEGLAAMFQAAFLAGASVFLVLESLQRLASPQAVEHHLLGISVAGISIILSLIVVAVQNFAIKYSQSLAVAADRSHYMSDLLLNGGVIVALAVNMQGGPLWVDTLCGILIAGYIAFTAAKIGKDAGDMLMDRELGDDVRGQIKEIVRAHKSVLGMHDLRTRRIGMYIHISFDIEADPELSLRDAHAISRDLEEEIVKAFPNADILIHIDPHGDTYDVRHRVQGVHH